MRATYNGRVYEFRKIDVGFLTQDQLQNLVDDSAYLQYEPSCVWLVLPGIGYAWEVLNCD